jgi:hypothetical protein
MGSISPELATPGSVMIRAFVPPKAFVSLPISLDAPIPKRILFGEKKE